MISEKTEPHNLDDEVTHTYLPQGLLIVFCIASSDASSNSVNIASVDVLSHSALYQMRKCFTY